MLKEKCKKNEFNIGNLVIPYKLSNNKKTSHIKFVIDIEGLKIIKPSNIDFAEVETALNKKSEWIYKNYLEFQSMKVEKYNRNWESGERILYKGRRYNLRVYKSDNKKVSINFNGKKFEVYTCLDFAGNDYRNAVESAFKDWFKIAARNTIREKLDYYCKIIGLEYNSFKIKEQKTRWGSCSKKGNLNFNWKILMAPPFVINYVVVHELCHLKYLNHSKKYWNMVNLYMPDYKKAQNWLKINGMGLSF